MRLLIFSPYYPPHIGGVENYTQELAEHLAGNNINVTIFTPHLPENSPKIEITKEKITIIRFPSFEIISNYPLPKFWSWTFWKMFSNLFKEKFDVTISQTRFFNTSLLALAYAKTKKVRWIHIEHGSDYINVSSNFTNKIARAYDILIGNLIFNFSDINISISKAVEKFINKFNKRISPVIYRGLNLAEIDSAPSNKELQEKYNNRIIIAFTGRLYKWKGVENSIKAVKSLPEEIKKKVIFIIAGDGEDFEKLQKTIDTSIIMLGNVPRNEAFGIQKIADIYIHSAYPGGGLATSLLEAMYCKCAIIATPNEGATDIIEDKRNGLLISESSPDLIRKSIEEFILNKELMISCKNNAHIFIEKNFSWNNSIDKLLKVIGK